MFTEFKAVLRHSSLWASVMGAPYSTPHPEPLLCSNFQLTIFSEIICNLHVLPSHTTVTIFLD